jgi:hypothetical protein
VLVDDLLPLQGGQRRNCISRIALACTSSMSSSSISPVRAALDGAEAPDERDDLVELVERLEVAAQDVDLGLGLAQPVCRAPHDDVDLVLDPVPDEGIQRQGARHLVDEREHVGAEGRLQLGVLVEVVEHDLGDGVTLEHDDQALAGAPGGLVADVGDAGQAPVPDQLGDLLREHVGVDLIGQLGDDQADPALDLLDLRRPRA